MEELRNVALAYYRNGTAEERDVYAEFFRSLDADGNGTISMKEFSEFFMQHEGYDFIPTTTFFDELDRDGSKDLGYYEVLTLYYIVKSGRPFCRQCVRFIAGLYFTCMQCFNAKSGRYCICLECFCGYDGSRHCHGVENFVDNFAMLEGRRKSAIATEIISRQNTQAVSFCEQSSASGSGSFYPWTVPGAPNGFQSSTSYLEFSPLWAVPPASNGFVIQSVSPWAVPCTTTSDGFVSLPSIYPCSAPPPLSQTQMVPYNPGVSNRFEKWKIALRVLEAGLLIGSLSMSCTIM